MHRNQPNNDRNNHKNCQIEPDSIRSKTPILTHHFKGERSVKGKHQRIVHPLKNKENKFKCESQIKATKNAQDMLLLLENLKGSFIYTDGNMNAIISEPMTLSLPLDIIDDKSVLQSHCDSSPAASMNESRFDPIVDPRTANNQKTQDIVSQPSILKENTEHINTFFFT